MDNNKKTYSKQEVKDILDKAVKWMDFHFDDYIGRSDYLPSEFHAYLNRLID